MIPVYAQLPNRPETRQHIGVFAENGAPGVLSACLREYDPLTIKRVKSNNANIWLAVVMTLPATGVRIDPRMTHTGSATATENTKKKKTPADELDLLLAEVKAHNKLESWNAFIEPLDIPGEFLPALMTMRPELIKLVTPRALTAEECASVFKLIAGLIETNWALQNHAKEVAKLTTNLERHFFGMQRMFDQIDHFANFKRMDEPEELPDD